MKTKHLLLVPLVMVALVTFAKELTGYFEIPQVKGKSSPIAQLRVTKEREGIYSARMWIGTDQWNTSAYQRVGEEFTFRTTTDWDDVIYSWEFSVSYNEVTITLEETKKGHSQEHIWTGKLTYDLEGTYEFPPPQGVQGHLTTVQLIKNDETDYSAKVTVFDKAIQVSNIIVSEDRFSFDTESKAENGETSQTWTVKIEAGNVYLSKSPVDIGQNKSMTVQGKIVNGESD